MDRNGQRGGELLMKKRILNFILAIVLLFSFTVSVSAEQAALPVETYVECQGIEEVEYTELEDAQRAQIAEILKRNGLSEEDVLGVFAYETDGNNKTISVPGWIVLTGKWLSAYQWKLAVLNAGTGIVNGYTMEAEMINQSYGPVCVARPLYFTGLVPGQSNTNTFTAAVYPADIAKYAVKGTVNAGEPFEISGADVRN